METNDTQPIIVWFRQDLRIKDNPALFHACKSGRPIIPVYILDDSFPGPWKMRASKWWLHHSLQSLDQTLQKYGSKLHLFKGDPLAILPNLSKKYQAHAVYWNRCYEPYSTIFLGGAGFFWTGSKLGWLVAMAVGGLFLLRLKWPAGLKIAAIAAVAIIGLGIFAARFHTYFAAGATSVGARLDYWRAVVQTTGKNPLFGTGPGTFQRPYAQLKPPDAEMARLAHNDYLEQFSDSGIPGGIFYLAWIALALATIGRKIWKPEKAAPPKEHGQPALSTEPTGELSALRFAILAGVLGWFTQGIGEFGLYIPALAWTAFTLLGCPIAVAGAPAGNQFDKKPAVG